jgi:hypothetical protein
MVVPEEDEWQFAYVLPKLSDKEPTHLVIPLALQMGWCDSPAYFCAASETARDVAEDLAAAPVGTLPAHPLEGMLLNLSEWPEECIEEYSPPFTHLMEVYINNFIQLAQTMDVHQLEHLSRAMLHAIHSVFPPPTITGHTGEDPISIKKLKQGDGLWAVRKEILGWVFDGARRCIELPMVKRERITSEIQRAICRDAIPRKQFEKLWGRL